MHTKLSDTLPPLRKPGVSVMLSVAMVNRKNRFVQDKRKTRDEQVTKINSLGLILHTCLYIKSNTAETIRVMSEGYEGGIRIKHKTESVKMACCKTQKCCNEMMYMRVLLLAFIFIFPFQTYGGVRGILFWSTKSLKLTLL